MKNRNIFRGIKIAFFVMAGALLMGYIMMSLWNWLIPNLFNGPHLTYLQAIGLLVLAKMLFGGFKGRGCCGGGRNKGRNFWKQRLEDKMSQLTPEERERFRKHISDRCRSWYDCDSEGEKKAENQK
ncbi:MAG: hypothetical protein IT235_00985 [Bacteroidia bacterium]|nr:hypothetical protein [Bacteroidia bacterium]